jgi:hypothetical protein
MVEEDKKFHTKTTKWSEDLENILKQIGESCIGYKWMNIFAARQNEKKYNIIMYLSIFIGPLAGVLSAIVTGDKTQAVQIVVTLLSFTNGFLSAIIKFSAYGEKCLSYKNIASKYASLETNIRRQLSLSREDRVNAGEYLEWISSSFDELFTNTPLISDQIYKDWVVFAKKHNLTIPKDLGTCVSVHNTDKVAQLSTTTSIDVNKEEKSIKQDEDHIEIVLKPRTTMDGINVDLNKYSDGKMQYELSRLFHTK